MDIIVKPTCPYSLIWHKPIVFIVLLWLFPFIFCEISYVLKNVFIMYLVSARKEVEVLSIYSVSYMEENRKTEIFFI